MSDVANTTTDNPAGLPANTPSLGAAQPGNPPAPFTGTVTADAGPAFGIAHPGTVMEPPDVAQTGMPFLSDTINGAVEEPGETY